MGRLTFGILALIAAVIFTSALCQADSLGDCRPAAAGVISQVADDTVIGACTQLIRSGTLSTKDLAEAYDRRGVAEHRLRQDAAAIADYNEALRLDPDSGTSLNNRGVVFSDQKRYALAIADFTSAMSKIPSNYPLPYANRADVYWLMGNLVQAETDFAQAIMSGGSYTIDYYNSRASVLGQMGRHADAILQLSDIVDRYHRQRAAGFRIENPNRARYAAALNNRCFQRAIVGESSAALSDCNESLSLRPGNARTLDSRALAEYKLGHFQDAIRDENAALATSPDFAEAYYTRGLAERRIGRASAGALDLRRASRLRPDVAREFVANGIDADGTVTRARDVSKFCRNGYKDPIVKC